MENNDLNSIYTTEAFFDDTMSNYTMPVEDNQVSRNQEEVVISGKIFNVWISIDTG